MRKTSERSSFVKWHGKKMLTTVLILAMTASIFTGCGLIPKEEELPTAPMLAEAEVATYTFAPVLRGDVIVSQTVRAMYVPAASEKLAFDIGGEYISDIYVSLGDMVKAGDVLMELDVGSIDEQITSQQLEIDSLNLQLSNLYANRDLALESAQIQDDQAAALGTEGWISKVSQISESYQQQINSLYSTLNVSQARLEELQQEKAERQIIAGIDGVITQLVTITDRYRTSKGESVVQISDMEGAMFESYSSNAMEFLKDGETYTLECNDEDYEVIAHEGSSLEGDIYEDDKMYLEMITPDPTIAKDDSGSIRIIVEQAKDVLYVQSSVIKELDGKTIVYVEDENGFRTTTEVKTGLSDGKITEIISGLEEGQLVIVP